MQDNRYHYIIAGAGCAGLSLAVHMLRQPALQSKKILLVDEVPKNQNDRTWCFWEKEKGPFETIVYKQWEKLWFHGDGFSKDLSIAPYRYKMIRGIDFYEHCFALLKKHLNVEFIQSKAEDIFSNGVTGVKLAGNTFTADYVFNSIALQKPVLRKKDIWFLQHFKGWLIETKNDAFDPDEATLMDFRISQKRGTAFCYVLPFTKRKALVEYTLFTPSLLEDHEYEDELQRYIRDVLKIEDFDIPDKEFGVIPMTNHRFAGRQNNIINIGTAGGQTKGSSGYTFYFIQQHSKALVESLIRKGHPFVPATPKRFRFYDSVLLQVLAQNSVPGKEIFTTLFRRNKPHDVLAFLNNASGLATEAKIISTLPTLPFLKAALRQM
jgi:lycopene beta-cyclase